MTSRIPLFLCSAMIALLLSACGQSQDPGSASPATTKEVSTQTIVESLTRAAEAGDAKAQFDLAKRFDMGDGTDKDQSKAFEWFLKSAEAGNVDAMIQVAKRYDEGIGIKGDTEKGDPWWQKAADAGNADAQYQQASGIGLVLSDGANILGEHDEIQARAELFVDWLAKAAAQNHAGAKYSLGMTYLLGATEFFGKDGKKLVQPDIEKGLPLIREAADAEYWEAQWAMAVLYQSGYRNLKPEKKESDKYWTKLSQQADPEIQRQIGWKYNATDRTQYQRGRNKYQGQSLTFDDTNKVAFEWFQKAADKNDKTAIFLLGQMYRSGRGIRQDGQKAIDLFKKAAELGHYRAQRELAFAYLEGNGVVKDYAQAHKWLLRAADEDVDSKWSGVHKTRNALGALNEFGWGVDKDLVLAYAWYNIAAAGDYDNAKKNLGRVEKALTPEELTEAQALSREWKPGEAMIRVAAQPSNTPGVKSTSGKGS